MKISFIMPCPFWLPIGGFKVAYEYANRLAVRGHRITVIHPASLIKEKRNQARFMSLAVKGMIKPPWRWFPVEPGVRMKIAPHVNENWIPDGDAVVATLWNTAEGIETLPEKKGKKFYFIQGLDTVFNSAPPDRVMNTWKLPFHKIVVSRWLEKIALNRGEQCTYIPNGLDFDEFNVDISIEARDPRTICLMNNADVFKGTREGLAALETVRERHRDVSILMIGFGPKPETPHLPITYFRNPTPGEIRSIFNRTAIFIGTSWCEGFGLPPCEAAACGAALCVSDNGGHREFALHGQTALVHPPRRPDILAENVIRLIEDNEKRIGIARSGNTRVKKFTWEKSVEDFERTLSAAR
ncbi:MAG: glycosyltransferase family 4 protein [Chitinispirillaceae bacterium]|nr:glycosyltransferase family 4 protein [Chitinispirillaceae bacterium]